jgi:hypothetical protein
LENHRYGVSLYFAFTTVTTTGYGDIQPFNDLERLMSTLLMLARTPPPTRPDCRADPAAVPRDQQATLG